MAAMAGDATGDTSHLAVAYVAESRFGAWFQRTGIWRHYVVEEAVAELVSLAPNGALAGARVLDAGCGDGVAFGMLFRQLQPARLLGVDIDPEAVARASGQATAVGGGVGVELGDASHLALHDCSIDIVFCHQLLHHANEPRAVLAEFHRVLVPGGWLLVAESCREFLDWWPVRLLFRHPPRPQLSALDYRNLVTTAGFNLTCGGYLTPEPFWSRRDLGIRRRLGWPEPETEPSQVRIAARRA